jgi:predicted enzyme related to lactoylglutathione lyase
MMKKIYLVLMMSLLIGVTACVKNVSIDSNGNVITGISNVVSSTIVSMETDNIGDASLPRVATDAQGNVIAVWEQYDGTRNSIYSNRYTAGIGWGTAELIDVDNTGNATSARVATDSQGNAIAVWRQKERTQNNIYANRYTAGTGWGTAELVDVDNTGNAMSPQVAVDAQGNAIAVWRQTDRTQNNIYANRYTAGTGWGTAELIDVDNTGNATSPQVAVDAQGNAIAVWRQTDRTQNNIYANRYTAGTGWGTAELMEIDNAGSASSPQVATDSQGNAIAVWRQKERTQNNIYANRYTAGTGWGTAELIDVDNTGNATSPQVAVDEQGNAIAVWRQTDRTQNNMYANWYTAGKGWGTAELVDVDNTGNATSPQVAVDAQGNAIAVWEQSDGTLNKIWANRYTAGTGWGTAELIDVDNTGNATSPQVAVDAQGNAIAVWRPQGNVTVVWYQSDGTRNNIYANRYGKL